MSKIVIPVKAGMTNIESYHQAKAMLSHGFSHY